MNGSSTLSSAGSPSPPSSSSSSTSPSISASSLARGPKKLLGSFNFANGGTFNWEIPPFPGEKVDEPKTKDELEVKKFTNRGSQVEDRDWALLEVQQNGLAFELCSDVGSNVSEENNHIVDFDITNNDETVFTKTCSKLRNEPRIDRGTYCDGFAGYFGYEEKVGKLAVDFPLADSSHIEEVLNACHGDYHWAFNLLSQFNEEHFTNAASSSVNISNRVNNNNDVQIIQESFDSSSSPSPDTAVSANEIRPDTIHEKFHGLGIASQLISDNLDQQNAQFTFYLDPAFADKLQSSFGQVLKEGENDEKYLRVECSEEVAQLIHYLWVKAYNSLAKDNPVANTNTNNFNIDDIFNFSSSSKPVTKSTNNGNNGNSSKKELSTNANKQMPYEPKSAFQEIMDLEMAINLSRKEFNSSPFNHANSKHAISTKLKRECLRASYPGLDEKALEELFEANDYRIKETIESIDDTLGIQTTITPEVYALINEESDNSDNYNEAAASHATELPAYNGDTLRQLRTQMDQYIEKRKELSDKGNSAFQAKMYAVASYYKSQAQEYDRKISDLRSQVIDTIVRANPSNSLDLHGVHSNEVLTTLGNYLSNKFEEIKRRRINKLRLLIITGRGAHSISGPKLKPLVINYLKQKRYRHEVVNPGVIAVTIP